MNMLRQMTWVGVAVLGVTVGIAWGGSDLWLGTLASLLVLLVEGE